MKKPSMRDLLREIEAIRPRAVLVIKAGDRCFYASPEPNASAKALTENLSPARLTVTLRDGPDPVSAEPLPFSLPQSAAPVTLSPGDLILLADGRVRFCRGGGEGTFTRLARIGGFAPEAFAEGATVELYLEWSE